MASHTLPVVSGDKDRSLQEAVGAADARRRGPAGRDARPDRHRRRTGCRRSPPSFAPFPEETDERLTSGARGARDRAALHASGRGVRARPRRPQRRHDHADGVGQDALLQRAGARRDPEGSVDARAVSVSDQGARAGSARRAARARPSWSMRTARSEIGVFTYDGDTPSDARRAIRGKAHVVLSNPDMLHSGILPHHPRWAKLFENLQFVVIDELHAYRGVFGSHLVEHPAAAAARLPALRLGSDLHLLVGDDRQSARAGRRADRAAVRAGRRERRAARREVLPVRQSAGRQRAARHPALVPGGSAPRRARVPQAQPAADPLRAEPAGDRDPDDLSEGCVPRPAGRRGRDPRLSRRLSAEPAPRDRARAARRAGARRRLDQRAGARHRHRRARRVGDGRLSGHDRRDLAARRPRRPAHDAIGGGAGREQRADRSVHRPQPVVFLRRVARARAHQSRQPAHPARPREVRRVRAAVQRRRAVRRAKSTCRRSSSVLGEEGFVHLADGQWNWTHESYPADAVSLRSVSSDNFVVVDTHQRRARDRRDRLHQRAGDAAREGDLHRRRAAVPGRAARLRRPQGVRARGGLRLLHGRDHVHEGDDTGYVRVEDRWAEGRCAKSDAEHSSATSDLGHRAIGIATRPRSHGEVHVVSRVVGFKKIKFYTNENVGSGELDLPEQQMHTSSYWLTIPAAVMASLPYGGDDRRDGVVGLAFAMRHVAQLLLMCDRPRHRAVDRRRVARADRREPAGVGGVPEALAAEPNIFIYDNYPGGIGFSRPLFEMHELLLERTRELIDGCPVRVGLSVVRRSRREHRPARQGRGVGRFWTGSRLVADRRQGRGRSVVISRRRERMRAAIARHASRSGHAGASRGRV